VPAPDKPFHETLVTPARGALAGSPGEVVRPPGEKLLVAHELEVSYGKVQALWAISFSVLKNQITCIIGANGAGKTTTLNAIAGILPAKAGHLFWGNEDITALPSSARVERHISLVPEGRHLWPRMTVEDNLLMGCFVASERSQAQDRLGNVYTFFPRLKERRRQMAGTLSGGEQQMCAIGRGLMSRPKLLMLDEPSLGLAPMLVEEIFEMIRSIAEQGVTILLVGQNVNYTLQISHYGYVMELGRISLEGPSELLRNHEHVRRAYLGGAESEPRDGG
jgi:branched-chain amino acid transport system ATP-binding protein